MKTQISRHSFNKDKRYSGIYQQQGRMITDADWNELVEIIKARLYESLGDAVASGSPRDGGLVDFTDPQTPKLNWGKVFVNGVPAEVQPDLTQFTEAAPPTALLEYDKQQDFPDARALPVDGNYVLYLDLWERPLIFLEDPELRDPGLHGADTCTRTQTMAQVKWCPPPADSSQPPDCLNTNLNPSKGNAIFQLAQRSDAGLIDPCNPDAEAVTLDQGAGNYLFRLEVHDVKGPADQPVQITLKWSAENGAEQHAVGSEPPDFKQGNWIYEFYNDTGEKHLGVHLVTDLSFIDRQNLITDGYPSVPPDGYPNVRRWDGYCVLTYNNIFTPPDNTGSWILTEGKAGIPLTLLASDVDEANAGQAKIRITNNTISLFLDTLVFDVQTDAKQFVAGDYWLGLIRESADAGERVKVLSPEPIGITHHYLKLASYIAGTIQLPTNAEQRQLSFPPLANLTADRIGYNPDIKQDRWEDINETPTGPLNVQQAIDDLIDNLESSDIWYTMPESGCEINDYGATTLKRYLEDIVREKLSITDPATKVKIKDVWDALLCHLDAKKLPYDPTLKPVHWNDVTEGLKDSPVTIQSAIDDLLESNRGAGVSRKITQESHGFSVGQAIYYDADAGIYQLARSNSEFTTGMFLISKVRSANQFILLQAGYIDDLTGLTPGEYYFVSADTSGALVAEEPVFGVSNPILYADSETGGYVLPYRPAETSQEMLKEYVDDLLVGSVTSFAMEAPPQGWLECNGQVLGRTEYAHLFNRIGLTFGTGDGATTFNVPDLRGEFIRGWDNARGIDSGRGLGQFQLDQIQSHGHIDNGHEHPPGRKNSLGYWVSPASGDTFNAVQVSGNFFWVDGTSYYTGNAKSNLGDPIARHGQETRSRNVALMYCIKY